MTAATNYQEAVQEWIEACFGKAIASDRIERNFRFLEEALELVQALDCSRVFAHKLVDYVYDRPVGEPEQEMGGVMVTLAALATANGMDMDACGDAELRRCWEKIDVIRIKQRTKPLRNAEKDSPLP